MLLFAQSFNNATNVNNSKMYNNDNNNNTNNDINNGFIWVLYKLGKVALHPILTIINNKELLSKAKSTKL